VFSKDKENTDSSSFLFSRKKSRKGGTNEKETLAMVRRVAADCGGTGSHGLYPKRCAGMASGRRICCMGSLGDLSVCPASPSRTQIGKAAVSAPSEA
jgi:hypothetical protein